MSSSILRLIRLLSGGFSNQTQAFENPPLFAHILVHFRPLPQLEAGSLLLEQSYAMDPMVPYRIRVLRPRLSDGQMIIDNQSIKDSQRFWGSVHDAGRRTLIESSDLMPLPGCSYVIKETSEGFTGEVEPGCRCLVERKGTTAYLVSSFEINESRMWTIDRGHDPQSHEQLWGALAGGFEFERTCDYSDEIPASWTEHFKN